MLKTLKHKYCVSLGTSYNVVQFTDLTPTIIGMSKELN